MEKDCIIIGSGITGLAASLKLAAMGFKCLVVDKSDLTKIKAGETLSPDCYRFFRELGIDLYQKNYCMQYTQKKVKWGSHTKEEVSFTSPFSFSILREEMEYALIASSVDKGNVVMLNTKVESITQQDNGWLLQIADNKLLRTIKGRLLIIATGRGQFKLIPEIKKAYFDKLIALSKICQQSERTPVGQLTIEEIQDGWLYSNSLPNNQHIFTAFTDSDLIEYPIQGLKQFNYLWSKTSSKNSLKFSNESNEIVHLFDARSFWINIQSGKGWLFLGDAAYSIDPLSGLGIKKNLQMIDFLVSNIKAFMAHDLEVAKEYILFNKINFEAFKKQGIVEYGKVKHGISEFWKRRQNHLDGST